MTTRPGEPPAKATVAARDPLDDFVDAGALLLGLPLDPAWRPAVKMNLQVTLHHAALVAEFVLPDDAEPAWVFTA
jgi:hypothetical protein